MAFDLGGLFSADSAFAQILTYGVMQQVIEAALGPALSVTTQDINAANPVEPITPPDLAALVARGFMGDGEAAATAAKSGVSAADFELLVKAAGDSLDVTTLMEAFRRRLIPASGGGPDGLSLESGIREGRLANKWIPILQALGESPIGVADAVDAVVENQIDYATGEQYAYENGLARESFKILVNTRGNPPGPAELAEMVRRGIIPVSGTGPDVLSFEQGISEGATKDKWIKAYEAAMTVEPPEGTVQTWLREGVIDTAEAVTRFKLLGYDEKAAANFAAEATSTKTTAYKQIAESDVIALYQGRAITAEDATAMLGALGYNDQEAALVLQVADFHVTVQVRTSAISKIRTYYLARKITDQQAITSLDALKVPAAQRTQLMQSWEIERTSDIKLLTEAQIADAWNYGILGDDEAIAELEAIGYTPFDAWVILSVKNKGIIGPRPAKRTDATG
jgi:hypothetical protein